MNTSHRKYVLPTRSHRLHILALSLSYGVVFGSLAFLWWALG